MIDPRAVALRGLLQQVVPTTVALRGLVPFDFIHDTTKHFSYVHAWRVGGPLAHVHATRLRNRRPR